MIYKAYIVVSSKPNAVFMDYSRALEYAQKYHGFLVQMYGQGTTYEVFLENVAVTLPEQGDGK